MVLFSKLEECYMVAMVTTPTYTMGQLVDKVYITILQTGLYKTLCAEFKGMLPEDQTYATLKEHIPQAFDKGWLTATFACKNAALSMGDWDKGSKWDTFVHLV